MSGENNETGLAKYSTVERVLGVSGIIFLGLLTSSGLVFLGYILGIGGV